MNPRCLRHSRGIRQKENQRAGYRAGRRRVIRNSASGMDGTTPSRVLVRLGVGDAIFEPIAEAIAIGQAANGFVFHLCDGIGVGVVYFIAGVEQADAFRRHR